MPLQKLFKRIYRPMLNGKEDYITDAIYSYDRLSFVHSYHLIEKDLKILFDYISPNNSNNGTFSHRIYELFFRCCTEFENNAAAILNDNGYANGGNMNISKDYFKINRALKLNEYQIRLNVWENGPLMLRPFAAWNTAIYSPLTWYQNYNSVKHNRTANFHLANLENLITAAAGLMILLYSQYAYHAFSPYQPISLVNSEDFFESANDSLFEVGTFPWSITEKYDFDWALSTLLNLRKF